MLYITTRNGVYTYDPRSRRTALTVPKRHTRGFFQRRAHGYWGMCRDEESGRILVASRERLGTPSEEKSTTDTKFFSIDPATQKYECIGTAYDVHQVHQIASYKNLIFVADTGKNRVHVYDRGQARVTGIINVGDAREDIHHINALLVRDGTLLVGLNNHGKVDAQILRLDLMKILGETRIEVSAAEVADALTLKGQRHTHDLVLIGEELVVCSSLDGRVVKVDTGEAIIESEHFIRGITEGPEGTWVGNSKIAERADRNRRKVHAYILHFSSEFKFTEKIVIPNARQIHALLWVDD